MDKIYILYITDNSLSCEDEKLLMYISQEKRDKIHRYQFHVDKKLSLYADVLIRYLACGTLGVLNDELLFSITEYGKPLLEAHGFKYNISHTYGAVAVGISDKPIGLDIERIKDIDYKIANRFFTANEAGYIFSFEGQKQQRFFEIWTKKEAYTKWMGKGLSIPLNSFDVLSNELVERIISFQVNAYMLSVCCEKNFSRNQIHYITETELRRLLAASPYF